MNIEQIRLKSPSPGTYRQLKVYRFQPSSTVPEPKKIYIQAGLHADEWPGLLVIQHLLPMLAKADEKGQIAGEIVIVPYANPVGLSQNVFGYVTGRFDLTGTGNFNRNFGDLYLSARDQVEGKLGQDARTNTTIVRRALLKAVTELPSADEASALKKTLLSLSVDADYIFDLHCDDRTSAHIYAINDQREAAAALCRRLQFEYLFLEDLDGAVAFDGTNLQAWHWLQKDFPQTPLIPPQLAVTIEYRGQYDVEEHLAVQDAANLYQYLVDIGLVQDRIADLPANSLVVSPLSAVDVPKAEAAGLLVFHNKLDAWVKKGDVFAEIIILDADKPNQRIPVVAETDGYLMGLSHRRMVRPGDQIAKIAGTEPLAHRLSGNLLQL